MKRFLGIWALMAIFMAALCQPVLEWLLNTADGFMAWPLLCGLAALLPAGLLSVWLSVRKQAKELERNVALADQAMYREKRQYYENSEHDRRGSSLTV